MCLSWLIISQFPYSINSYQFLDSATVYAVSNNGTLNSDPKSIIMKSINGGIVWQEVQSFIGSGLEKIYFSSSSNSCIVGRLRTESLLLKNVNDQESWIMKNFGTTVNDIFFTNIFNGKLADSYPGFLLHDPPEGNLFSTTNGGISWVNTFCSPLSIKSFAFFDDSIGFYLTVRGYYSSEICKTTDCGNTWINVLDHIEGQHNYRFSGNDICFMNEENAFVAGDYYYDDTDSTGAGILVTSDGGENWDLGIKFPYSDFWYSLNSIHFYSSVGWAVGESGLIVKYTPQSEWIKQTPLTDVPLRRVFSLISIL